MQTTDADAASRTGSRVRGLMAEKRITQDQVAQALGVTQPAIARRLNGSVPFDVNELALVAELLGVADSALIGRRDG